MTGMIELPPLLKVPEVARLFRVCDMTIYRQVTNGELEAIKMGGSIRIRTAAVIEKLRLYGFQVEEAQRAVLRIVSEGKGR